MYSYIRNTNKFQSVCTVVAVLTLLIRYVLVNALWALEVRFVASRSLPDNSFESGQFYTTRSPAQEGAALRMHYIYHRNKGHKYLMWRH